MAERNLLGLIAAGVATLCLFIAVCIFKVNHGSSVMVLLAFLAGGLCAFIRLLSVLSSSGTLSIGAVNDNKKLINMGILATAFVSGLFTFVGFVWITIAIADVHAYGWSLSGAGYFGYACVIISGVAGLGNVVLGFLDFRESGGAPAS